MILPLEFMQAQMSLMAACTAPPCLPWPHDFICSLLLTPTHCWEDTP